MLLLLQVIRFAHPASSGRIMEYWKDGIMGFGKMVDCYYGGIHLDIETKMLINYVYFFSKQHSNIPSFHYSMFRAKI